MTYRERGKSSRPDIQSSHGATREFVIVLPLVAVITTLPWLFGGVYTSSQILLAGCASLTLLVCVVSRPERIGALPLTLLPLLLAIALGIFQQWPLGEALATISPRTHSLWAGAAPASEGALAMQLGILSSPNNSSISLYPLSTRRDVILLLTAVAVFYLASQLLSHRKWQRWLFGIVAANGAVFAFFGIAQQLVWNGQIYGQVPLTQGGRPFAAFVNSNNAGGYLNLCLAAAIGFSLYAFSRNDHASAPHRSRAGDGRLDSFYRRVVAGIGELNGEKLLSLLMLILIFAGLLCALSRGAWVSLLVSAAVVVGVLAANRRVAYVAATLVLVVALGFGLVHWLGRTESISARWESLNAQLTAPSDGRLSHWSDGLRAGSEFWLLGSGLGTYRYVYRPYASTDHVWFYHAENQYVEAFCEGGVLGLSLMLAAIVTMALACRTLFLDHDQQRRICGIVGTYALVSQAVHALFDFGLYLPANTALFALICGTVTGASALGRRTSSGWQKVVASYLQRPEVRAGFASLLFCALLLGIADLNNWGAVETALKKSRVADSYERDSVASVTDQIRELSATLTQLPSHADGQQQLARLWTQRYRLQSLAQLQATAPAGTSNGQLWPMTLPLVVQGTAYRYATQGRTIELENLRRSEPVQTDLNNAARALAQAIGSCPLLSRAHLLLGEIVPIVSAEASAAPWLSSAVVLAGGNVPLLNECAVAQMQAGQVQDALATLHRMVELAPEKVNQALQLATLFVEPALAVDQIAPNSPQLLVRVAGSDYGRSNDPIRDALLVRAEQLLQVAALDPAERNQIEGSIHALMARNEQAIELLQKAVADRPEMTAWRYELASLLQQQGDLEGAWKHARTCARMEPDNEQFGALFQQLNRTRLRQKG